MKILGTKNEPFKFKDENQTFGSLGEKVIFDHFYLFIIFYVGGRGRRLETAKQFFIFYRYDMIIVCSIYS